MPDVLCSIVLLTGLGLLAVSVMQLETRQLVTGRGLRTVGVVSRLRQYRSSFSPSQTMYEPMIRFVDRQGDTYEVPCGHSLPTPNVRPGVGSRVELMYLPEDPAGAYWLPAPGHELVGFVLPLLAGVVCVVGSVIAYTHLR